MNISQAEIEATFGGLLFQITLLRSEIARLKAELQTKKAEGA